MIRSLLLAAAAAAAASPGLCRVRVVNAVLPAPAPGAPTAAAYAIIENRDGQADVLTAASIPKARAVTLHQMTMAGGIMRMRAVPSLPVPARGRVVIGPSTGMHFMITGLTAPRVGSVVPLRLTFRRSGTVDVALEVTAPSAPR